MAAIDSRLVHEGYPLLQPLILARTWTFVGADTVLVPLGLAVVSASLVLTWLFVTDKQLRGTAGSSF